MAVHEPIHNHRDADGRVVLTPQEARQGALGRPVLYVLVVGLLLAMLATPFARTVAQPRAPRHAVRRRLGALRYRMDH